jgi:glycosyltransferase involved in cell wall biosynthesis
VGCAKLFKREQNPNKSFKNVKLLGARTGDFVNILELNDNFLPKMGGTQVHMYSLCRCLVARGHKPIVLAWEPSKPSFEVMDKIIVHRFWMPFLFQMLRYPAILYLSLRILSLMRRYKIEIIHAHDYFCGLASVLAGRFLGKPIVVTFHIPMWFQFTCLP